MLTEQLSECLTLGQIEQFVGDGTLDPQTLRHMESCTQCQGGVQRVRENNEMLRRLAEAKRKPPSHSGESRGYVIDRYRLLERLGEGGFGEVWLADQVRPVVRRVAVKILKLGMDTRQVIARFEAERQALAMMDHPNIARVLDGGVTEGGQPYFVMELVRGEAITVFCDRNKLPVRDRLELFRTVCSAVQHAHQKGVIHRDIKPNNILVTVADGRPLARVIDFGIAKAIHFRLTDKTLFTELRQLIGTPEYMSPEQADPGGIDIDTRSDIYALGVLLYELLTGVTPLDGAQLRSAALVELQRLIREEEPKRPSARLPRLATLDTAAANRGIEPKRLPTLLRGELDWIVMKCLEKDRNRRYDTANALGDDVQRYLGGQAVSAGPPSKAYRFKKALRRNKTAALASCVVLVVLIGTLVVIEQQRRRAVHAELLAESRLQETDEARDEAEQAVDFLANVLANANPAVAEKEVTLREILDESAARVATEFATRPLIEARLRSTIGWTYRSLGILESAEQHLSHAAMIYTHHLGADSLRTQRTVGKLAAVIRDRGHLDKSEADLRALIAHQLSHLGLEDCRTLDSMDKLATTLLAQGRFAEAEALNRKTLALWQRVAGEEDPRTLESMNNLANSLLSQGLYVEAEEIVRDTLDLCRQIRGEQHVQTFVAKYTLANCIHKQGRFAEAESLRSETLEAFHSVYGPKHSRTVKAMSSLGESLCDLGRYAEAELRYRQAHEIWHDQLGETHPDTLAAATNLAYALCRQGRFRECEELSTRTLEIERTVLDHEHPLIGRTLQGLAYALEKTGQYEEAEPLCREAESIFALRLPEHRDRRENQILLGGILAGLGQYSVAKPLLIESYETLRDDPGVPLQDKKEMIGRIVHLYESWDAAEPSKGYAEKAKEYRAMLETMPATSAEPEPTPEIPSAEPIQP